MRMPGKLSLCAKMSEWVKHNSPVSVYLVMIDIDVSACVLVCEGRECVCSIYLDMISF